MVQTQFSRTIKIFRSDNAMEYNEKSFQNFLKQNGTLSHRSCPYTSQQNGHAERKHRHILVGVGKLTVTD
jgi:transposase InsO family protein